MTTSTGALSLTRRYDLWGQLLAGAAASGPAFTGREWDAEIGLYYYRSRYYDPKTGRFISEDPSHAESNPYAYVANNPVNRFDPFGLINIPVVNGKVERALLASAKENGFALSKDGAKQLREEMAVAEMNRLNDEKASKDAKLDVLEEIAKRVLKRNKDPKVNKELQDMIDARNKAKEAPTPIKGQCP